MFVIFFKFNCFLLRKKKVEGVGKCILARGVRGSTHTVSRGAYEAS